MITETGAFLNVAATSVGQGTLTCPDGTRMLNGGMLNPGDTKEVVLISSYPNSANEWHVRVYNSAAVENDFRVVVSCLQK